MSQLLQRRRWKRHCCRLTTVLQSEAIIGAMTTGDYTYVIQQSSLLPDPPDYDCNSFSASFWSQRMSHTSSEDDECDQPEMAEPTGAESPRLLLLDDDENDRRNTDNGLPSKADRVRRRRSAPTLPNRHHRKCISSTEPSFETVLGSSSSTRQFSDGDDIGKNAFHRKTARSSSQPSHTTPNDVDATAGLDEGNVTVVMPSADLADDVESSTFVEDVAAIRRLLFVKTATSGSTSTTTKVSSSSSVSSTPRRSVNRLVEEQRSNSVVEIETVL